MKVKVMKASDLIAKLQEFPADTEIYLDNELVVHKITGGNVEINFKEPITLQPGWYSLQMTPPYIIPIDPPECCQKRRHSL